MLQPCSVGNSYHQVPSNTSLERPRERQSANFTRRRARRSAQPLDHMDTTRDDLGCEKCGDTAFDSLVQHGSYLLRCSSCHALGPATSWIALGPKWVRPLKVFKDGELSGLPLLEGLGSDIWREISDLAADGTTLILR